MLWKDYTHHILSDKFCEISLELISLAFKVRLTVYTVTDDGILNAMIFNNKFEQSLQLIRPFGCHFDVVFSEKCKQEIADCKKIVVNVVNRAIDGPIDLGWEDVLDKAKDAEKSQTDTKDTLNSIPEGKERRQGHRRARSDPKLKASDSANDSPNRLDYYKSFIDSKSSEEVSSLIKKDLAKLGDKDIVLPNLAAIHEAKHTGSEEAGLKLGNVKSISSTTRVPIEEVEDEELGSPDFNVPLSKSKSMLDPKALQRSPVHFINTMPPGLTPNRYSTKTYSEDFSQAMATSGDTKDKAKHTKTGSFSHLDEESYHQPNKPRMAGRALSLTIQSEEFRKHFGNLGPAQEHELQGLQKNPTPEKKKPVIIDESHQRYTGRLKFFDEGKNYGFIVMDDDGSDIFVHYDDLHKANITKDFLKTSKFGNSIKLSFSCLEYIGKYNRSRKATDIQFLNP